MNDTSAQPASRDRAAWQVRDHIWRIALTAFDATETYDPIAAPGRGPTLDDPLVGVRAAKLTADVAAAQLREWALRARGAGRTWDDVADALDLAERDGESAWEWLIEHRPPAPGPEPWRTWPASAVWTCTTCRGRVRDSGPFASHPDDRERGHAARCSRHAEAVAEWRRETGLDVDHHEPEEGESSC